MELRINAIELLKIMVGIRKTTHQMILITMKITLRMMKIQEKMYQVKEAASNQSQIVITDQLQEKVKRLMCLTSLDS